MGKPKGSKGKKGGKGGGRGKGKVNAQTFYSAQERSQAYLVNAERVAAGLAPASIALPLYADPEGDQLPATLSLIWQRLPAGMSQL